MEQLGSDSIAVRIGAVYSFARLMRDSEPDQQAITEILSTFVRVQASQVPLPDESGKTRSLPVDSKAALQVLNAFEERTHPVSGATLLAHVDLSRFDLREVELSGANLTSANLTGADLRGAKLNGADLTFANLSTADLTFADLNGANLYGTDLTNAELYGTDLTNAELYGTDLTNADLHGANLDGTNLTRVFCSAETKWPAGLTSAPQC